jgi:PAS domain S-box-containing protein
VIGTFDRRITVLNQQQRALNLAWSLVESNTVPSGDDKERKRVAIVGGGFAGLTFAAALVQKQSCCDIVMFEERDTLLPLQQGSDSRWLHPRIYDWPGEGSEAAAAMLPVLNWTAARASDVVVQVLGRWKEILNREDHSLDLWCNARHLQLSADGEAPDRAKIEWVGEMRDAANGTCAGSSQASGSSDAEKLKDSERVSWRREYATLQADVKSVLRKLAVIERKVARNDGSMSFVLRIRPYRTVDNVIDGVVCTFVDMTEREAADAMLRESESQFHALADSIPQLAWIADAEGEIFWFNRRWYEYTGTNRAEIRGGGWRGLHHPDQIDPMLARFKRCVAAGKPWEDTYQLRGADGEYRWLLSRAEPIHDSGGKSDRFHCARNGSRDPTAGVLDR